MRRVKRDLEARRAREKEKAEVERRRNMTEDERRAEDEYAHETHSLTYSCRHGWMGELMG